MEYVAVWAVSSLLIGVLGTLTLTPLIHVWGGDRLSLRHYTPSLVALGTLVLIPPAVLALHELIARQPSCEYAFKNNEGATCIVLGVQWGPFMAAGFWFSMIAMLAIPTLVVAFMTLLADWAVMKVHLKRKKTRDAAIGGEHL